MEMGGRHPPPGVSSPYFFFAFFLVAFFFIEGLTSSRVLIGACPDRTAMPYFFFFLAAFFFATDELTSFLSPALRSRQKPMASRRRCCAWSAPRGS